MKGVISKIVTDIKPSMANIGPDEDIFGSRKLDSYEMVLLITELENHFSITIPGQKMSREYLGSINSIAKLVSELKNK